MFGGSNVRSSPFFSEGPARPRKLTLPGQEEDTSVWARCGPLPCRQINMAVLELRLQNLG